MRKTLVQVSSRRPSALVDCAIYRTPRLHPYLNLKVRATTLLSTWPPGGRSRVGGPSMNRGNTELDMSVAIGIDR
jgi:hypothetical protein